MEFSIANLPSFWVEPVTKEWNQVLEQENVGYRIIGGQVVEITTPHEIAQIQEALSSGVAAVQEHIRAALDCLSDRENPNYRNAIKESISAVESVCKLITGEKTLGAALKAIRDNIQLHPALEKGLMRCTVTPVMKAVSVMRCWQNQPSIPRTRDSCWSRAPHSSIFSSQRPQARESPFDK